MSQRTGPPAQPPYPQWDPPVQWVREPIKKRFGLLALSLSVSAALLLGIGIGFGVGLAGGDLTGTATPAPTVAVTETVEVPVEVGGAPNGVITHPKPDAAEAAYNPKPKDFKIGVQILEKQCFGSAGCSIAFRIVLSYVGSQSLPAEGVTEVTYVVTGGVRLITRTSEFRSDETATIDNSFVDTSSSSPTLTPKITKVAYDKLG